MNLIAPKPRLDPHANRRRAAGGRTLGWCCVLLGVLALESCKRDDGGKVTLPPLGENAVAARPVPELSSALAAASAELSRPAEAVVDASGFIHLTGNTEAHRRSLVGVASRGGGLLTKVYVREGDFVKEGQLLAQLDTTEVSLMIRQAEAGLAVAHAQAKAAEREHKRLETLVKDKAVPGMQLDQATTATEATTAGVAASEAQLAQAHKALGDASVHAPFAGLIGMRLKSEGEWVATMPPGPLFELVEITPLDLYIQAPEHLLNSIAVGDEVVAHFNSIGRSAKAVIKRTVPIVRPPARSFLVVAEFSNEDRGLSPGLFADVEIRPKSAASKAKEESVTELSTAPGKAKGPPSTGKTPAGQSSAPSPSAAAPEPKTASATEPAAAKQSEAGGSKGGGGVKP